jgi:hypothetical protein
MHHCQRPEVRPSPRHGQAGQTLIVFALVCAFTLLGTIALVGNTQVLYVNSDRADAAALLAAQAGASAIDEAALYDNRVLLDPALAVSRCDQAARQAPYVVSVRCDVRADSVTATVVERVDLPVPLWSGAETLQATRTARPAFGGHTGGF